MFPFMATVSEEEFRGSTLLAKGQSYFARDQALHSGRPLNAERKSFFAMAKGEDGSATYGGKKEKDCGGE